MTGLHKMSAIMSLMGGMAIVDDGGWPTDAGKPRAKARCDNVTHFTSDTPLSKRRKRRMRGKAKP